MAFDSVRAAKPFALATKEERDKAWAAVGGDRQQFTKKALEPIATNKHHEHYAAAKEILEGKREAQTARLFERMSLNKTTAISIAKNGKLRDRLMSLAREAGVYGGCDKQIGELLYTIASKLPPAAVRHSSFLVKKVLSKEIDSTPKIDEAIRFLSAICDGDFEEAAFNEASGIGVVVTQDDIIAAIKALFAERKAEIEASRYRINVGPLLANLKQGKIKFADGKLVKSLFDAELVAFLGPKTEQDEAPQPKSNQKTAPAAAATSFATPAAAEAKEYRLPSPTDNLDHTTGLQRNKPEILKKHLETTKGTYITRFPPEPNGYLHIGHAKAMLLDFGLATQEGGGCNLRFDDTNPEAESQEFIDSIIESVKWLGHTPRAITYSSECFDQLFDLAVELIKRDKAYVCFQTSAEMAESREKRLPSPYRNRPIQESLKLFDDMKKGKFAEGVCTLRMKQDLNSPNPNMWDLVAYRVKYTPHPHVGDKWCIYPSYDYTHCIVDSLENITHSLCTLEFQPRHESYMWLLDVLDLYKPHVWEFSRLNISHTMLSKRRLTALVARKFVRGWDDPRMPTLVGLRRRGYTAKTINRFCHEIGITRRGVVTHSIGLLEQVCRTELDDEAPRSFAVLNPLTVKIVDWENEAKTIQVEAPNHPRHKHLGSRVIPFTPVFFIEKSDFRPVDASDYFGLAPNKTVSLKYANLQITCVNVIRDASGEVTAVECTHKIGIEAKTKGFLHWVPSNDGKPFVTAEIRNYETLFKSAVAGGTSGDWIDDLNERSEVVITNAALEPSIASAKLGDRFQFERVGYYAVDVDSKPGNLVFNRVVTMKDAFV